MQGFKWIYQAVTSLLQSRLGHRSPINLSLSSYGCVHTHPAVVISWHLTTTAVKLSQKENLISTQTLISSKLQGWTALSPGRKYDQVTQLTIKESVFLPRLFYYRQFHQLSMCTKTVALLWLEIKKMTFGQTKFQRCLLFLDTEGTYNSKLDVKQSFNLLTFTVQVQ